MAKGDRNPGWPGSFRAFAVLCAVMLLLAQSGQRAVTIGSGSWQVFSVYEGLTSWAVPALFLLWGMAALDEGKPRLSASMLRLALPAFCTLVFWGALYAVVGQCLSGGAVSWSGVGEALVSAVRGDTYAHLWILYPLIGLYLVHPVLHRFTAAAGRGEVRYFLGLCFLFASLLPMWAALHPGSWAVALLERLRVHLVLGWVGCYVAGWYLRRYVISQAAEFVFYLLGILGMVLTLLGNGVFGGGRELWYRYTAPNVILTAVAFCVLFRYVLDGGDKRTDRPVVRELGSYAVGIYLFHPIWVLVFQRLGISVLSLPAVISVPAFALVFFLLSAPFAWLLRRIPVVGDYLTGT